MTTRNGRSYWIKHINIGEYEIGIASDEQSAQNYKAAGYMRITRDTLTQRLTLGPAQHITIDSIPLLGSQENFAKALRSKKALAA